MAYLDPTREAWTYTDAAGYNWRVSAVTSIVSQGKQGGAAAASTVPPKPADIKMARVTVRSAAGHSRTVPIYSGAQTLVVGGVLGTINLNYKGVETTYTAIGSVIPEQRPRISVTN